MAIKWAERVAWAKTGDDKSGRYEIPVGQLRDGVGAPEEVTLLLSRALGRALTTEDASALGEWWDLTVLTIQGEVADREASAKPPAALPAEWADHVLDEIAATEEAVYTLARELRGQHTKRTRGCVRDAADGLAYLTDLVRWCRQREKHRPGKSSLRIGVTCVRDLMTRFGLTQQGPACRIFAMCADAHGLPVAPDIKAAATALRKALRRAKKQPSP